MKKLYYLLVFFTLAGCGDLTRVTTGSNNTLNLNTSWITVRLSTPATNSFGGTNVIDYNAKQYLVGSQTAQTIQNYIEQLPAGSLVTKEIIGQFSQETGRFPNPTATFDVIHIQQMR